MPSLPIPMISALVLTFFLLRLWVTDRRHGPLVILLALCALQGFVISLAQHYGVSVAWLVQPVTASVIPPMARVAFQTTAVRRMGMRAALHLIGPVLVTGLVVARPQGLDLLIPMSFLGYGAAIIWHCRNGGDALPGMRFEAGDMPGLIWQIIGWALVVSAL